MKVRWTLGAVQQLDRVYGYYAPLNLVAAARMYRQIERTVQRLEAFPDSGRLGRREGTRELVVSRAPFLVIYRVTDREVQILRVLHTASDWQHLP